MSRRVWIDVTDFLKWQGSFTAFQHIQYHMAKHYLASSRDVKFFVYVQEARRFSEVDFNPDELSNSGVRSSEGVHDVRPGGLVHMAKRLTPTPVKKLIKKAMGREQAAPMPQGTDSPFQKGDVVLVLGGIWHGTFAEDMASEKKKRGFTFVHIVHDMIPVVVPQCVVEDMPDVFASYKEKIFSTADGLVINSQSSKKDAETFMKTRGIKPPKSIVFRLADERPTNEKEQAVTGLKSGEFILMLGTVEGRKNPWLLYYAYKQALREGTKLPKLVIAGRRGWLVDDFLYTVARDPDVKDKIVVLDGVSNAERAWLFNHCMFTVWTSFYEGWGMPVAESLTYGKVCISSDQPAMPEIGGKLVEYFSPYNPAELVVLITKYMDPKVRAKKEADIKKLYKPTTWADMYKSISSFVDSL